MNDQLLWDELRQGSKAALKKIYDGQIEYLLQYGCRFCQAREMVEDCIHDLFIYLWQNRENLGSTDSIRRYLLVALRRRIFKAVKKVAGKEETDSIPFDVSLSIEEMWIRDEENSQRKQALQHALEQLSERQKEALYLRFFQDVPYEGICQIMDINYQSVRNLIYGSIQAMRKIMVFDILFFLLAIS